MKRKEQLVTGSVYHILNKSIAGYNIFSSHKEYERFLQMIRFFSADTKLPRFSRFISQSKNEKKSFEEFLEEKTSNKLIVDIIAYCIMPTHFHLVLKQLKNNSIANFVGNFSGTYAREFNSRHKRKGFLWEDRFKNILITSNEQLLHLTRYIHLNSVTAGIVEKPEQWKYSSYKEYVEPEKVKYPLCRINDSLAVSPSGYRKFVEEQKEHQRELAKIKKIILE